MSEEIKLTGIEQDAIGKLRKLAAKWPKSLMLFSQAGSLLVLKRPDDAEEGAMLRYIVADIGGIQNDGGDADY